LAQTKSPDMYGKVCLVTGGNSGVGKATARGLARLGAKVVLLCRNEERCKHTLQELYAETGNSDLHFMLADLASQSSIRHFVTEFKSRFEWLHVLSNTAGMVCFWQEETEDGIEKTLAVDYLSHFLLTNLLLPLLKRSAPSRILTVAGSPWRLRKAKIHFDDLGLTSGYSWVEAAVQAALARVLFSHELARRLEGTKVSSNAFHPGLVKSHLWKGLPWYGRLLGRFIVAFFPKECKTSVYLASSPEVEGVSGKLFVHCRPLEFRPEGYDETAQRRLWEISEKLCGLR